MFLAKADLPDAGFRPPPAPDAVAAAVAAHAGRRPATVDRPFAGGTRHALYRAGFDDGSRVVVRVCLSVDASGPEALVTGAMAGHLAAAAGVATPVPIAVDLSGLLLPHPYELLPDVCGARVSDLEDPDTQALPAGMLQAIGRSLAAVHAVRGEGAGPLVAERRRLRGRYGAWEEHVRNSLARHVDACVTLAAVSRPEAAAILGLFDRRDDLLVCGQPRLLHGDPSHQNALVLASGAVAWVDWEDARFGDPVFDLANWATFCRDEALAPMLQGYRAAATLPADFDERFWLLYLRVALAKTVVRARLGIADRPGRPPASQRIQKALTRLQGVAMAA
jgi:aminoglycoside phosphotransferase (APT) family kinase protein